MERKERNGEEENKQKLVEQVEMNVVEKERKKGIKTDKERGEMKKGKGLRKKRCNERKKE